MTTSDSPGKYRAFISYSHTDERWADWLQRALEKYRVPKKLGKANPDRRRLNPVFRDRNELASSTDLGDSIRTALKESDALVVVCSPSSAASRWVNEEIRCFRDLVPGGKILCCLVDGDTDPASPDCGFPPAMLKDEDGHALPEPLAADVRDVGDGKRAAFFKIAAGLLDVGIDDLRQRDLQRRNRFLVAATSAAVLVAAITAGLAVNAYLARQESELRRAQAENLIEFMLVELREQLTPIGKLSILDSVGDQALEYFAALDDMGSSDEVLARALALRQIGEVRFDEGRLEAALEAFEESRRVAADLHHSKPGNNSYLFELGQSEFWVGYVAWERGDLEAASRFMDRYMQHTRQLYERDPDNPDYRLELLYSHSNLGSIAREAGESEEALRQFAISADIAYEMAQMDPKDPDAWNELRESQSWLGAINVDLGMLDAALDSYQSAADSGKRAHSLDDRPRNLYNHATELLHLSTVQMHLGRAEEAQATLDVSKQALQDLVEFDSENARWQRDFARVHYRLGEALTALGQLEAALEMTELAYAISGNLAELDPSYGGHQLDLASIEWLKARHLAQKGSTESALELARQAYERTSGLMHGSSMKTLLVEHALVAATLGQLQILGGVALDARATWRTALGTLPDAESCDLMQAAARLRLLQHLGLDQGNERLAARIKDAGFNDPRFSPFAMPADPVVE
jgi:tetratricopeptide (TPR) repeat protein